MEEITTPNPATDADPVAPATDPAPAGNGADGSGNSIPLATLKEVLGKDFVDADGALKSIKDTYSYVGSQAQFKEQVGTIAQALGTDEAGVLEVLTELSMSLENQPAAPTDGAPEEQNPKEGNFVTREELDENNFFAANPQLADLKAALGPIKAAHGQDMSWSEFAQTDIAKNIIGPITGFREIEQQKSALESNPRLGAVTDSMSKARESMAAANEAARAGDRGAAVAAENVARESAIEGVISAYELDK